MPDSRIATALSIVVLCLSPGYAKASVCDSPRGEWLMCEDFERGDLGWADWWSASSFVECRGCTDGVNDPNRLMLSDSSEHAFDGRYGVHMPAAAGSDYQGGELVFRSCVGDGRPGCELTNYDRLYLRAQVKLAADHEYVHHFLSIGGTRPSAYWEGSGNAGCRPNGARHAGTTVDFGRDRELFFYTYYPEMSCDSGGYCSGSYAADICAGCAGRDLPCESGPECCWGNAFRPPTPQVMPRGEWVCLEMMMEINTPGESDGRMAFWIDDELAHEETGMHWRDVPELGLNRANMSHYIARSDADRPNAVSFDDFIVSTERIGCTFSPVPDAGLGDAGTLADGGIADGGATSADAGSRDASSGRADAASPDAGTDIVSGCRASGSSRPGGLLIAFAILLRRRR